MWKVSNTKAHPRRVVSVLGVCGRALNTKTTPTWVISVLDVCGRAVVVVFVSHYHFALKRL